jgi:prepilin-type N-terminal cleavage/methylation domain-containing protein
LISYHLVRSIENRYPQSLISIKLCICNLLSFFGHINKAGSFGFTTKLSARSVILNSIFIEESSIVAIRPPKYNSQGFTLVEVIVVIMLAGIITAIGIPSLLGLSKPLRDGSTQFKSQLSLIRSKAIGGNRAYRIRPKYPTTAAVIASHTDPLSSRPTQAYPQAANSFIVEYAANCQTRTYGTGLSANPANPTYPNGTPDGWQAASQLNIDLPAAVGVTAAQLLPGTSPPTPIPTTQTFRRANDPTGTGTTRAFDSALGWSICYDNRGVAFESVSVTLTDYQANNQAKTAEINVGVVESADIKTYNSAGIEIPPSSQGKPVF